MRAAASALARACSGVGFTEHDRQTKLAGYHVHTQGFGHIAGIPLVGLVPGIFYNLETIGGEYEAGNPLRLDVIGPPKTSDGSFQNDCVFRT